VAGADDPQQVPLPGRPHLPRVGCLLIHAPVGCLGGGGPASLGDGWRDRWIDYEEQDHSRDDDKAEQDRHPVTLACPQRANRYDASHGG
jgi:hypothetical protein